MYIKISSLIISSLLLLTTTLNAQRLTPNFQALGYNSQYYFQQALINPAFCGVDGQANLSINHSFREINNNSNITKPQHYSLLFQNGFETLNDFDGGYGLSFVYKNQKLANDKDKFFLVNAIFAGGFDFGEGWVGRIGLTIGALHYSNIYREKTQKGTTGAAFFKLNLDAGVLLTKNDFSFGFSVVQSNEPKFGFSDALNPLEDDIPVRATVNNEFIRAVYFQAMYDIKINDEFVVITPLLLLSNRRSSNNDIIITNNRTNRNRLIMDIGANVLVNDIVFGGIHARLFNGSHSVSLMAGAKINHKIQVTLSYDVPRSDIRKPYRNIELSAGFFFGDYE